MKNDYNNLLDENDKLKKDIDNLNKKPFDYSQPNKVEEERMEKDEDELNKLKDDNQKLKMID